MIAHRKDSVARKIARRSGFTLMEILVVVAIIVVLAGAGTFYLLPLLGQSKEKVAKLTIANLTEAAKTYKLNNGEFPASLDALAQTQPNGNPKLVSPDSLKDPWGRPFQYDPSGPKNEGMQPDISTLSPETAGKVIANWPGG
jgi:general secretion pathway protein G